MATSHLEDTHTKYQDFAHTGPNTLAGRYLRSFWQPISRSEDLDTAEAKAIRIMGEDFTLYRGAKGDAHLVANRCAHRGTQLFVGWVEDDAIRCRYHGWKYDGSGQCLEQPGEHESFAHKIKIPSYPVTEYLGLVFAYLGAGAPPEFPRYPDWERAGYSGITVYVRNCNYFQYVENHCDPAHQPWVHHHRWSSKGKGPEHMPTIISEEMEWGTLNRIIEPSGAERWNAMGMPNVHEKRLGNPHRAGLSEAVHEDRFDGKSILGVLCWNVPIDDESNYEFALRAPGDVWSKRFENGLGIRQNMEAYNRRVAELAEAVLNGDMAMEKAEEFALTDPTVSPAGRGGIDNVQDSVAQIGQGRIAQRDEEHLGREDTAIIAFRKLWRQELRALEEDRPLREWVRPEWFYGMGENESAG